MTQSDKSRPPLPKSRPIVRTKDEIVDMPRVPLNAGEIATPAGKEMACHLVVIEICSRGRRLCFEL